MAQAVILIMLMLASDVWAATRYVSLSGSDTNTCAQSEDPATPKRTLAAAVGCIAAGDTLYIRGGVWNERLDFQSPSKTGTSSAWITVAGYPGEQVILRYTDSVERGYGAVRARGNRGYFIFQDFEIDGINFAHDAGWQIRDGNHHFTLRRLKIYNQDHSGIYVDATDVLLEENDIHDLRSSCIPGDRHHALYLHNGSNLIARRNILWNTPGGGIQLYPGPWTNAKLQDNFIHHTNTCSTSNTGGIVVGSDDRVPVGSIIDTEVTGNIIAYTNRKTDGTGNGTAMGLRVYNNGTLGHVVSGTKVHNNTIYKVYNYTVDPLVGTEYCMNIASGAVNTDVRNNYMSDCAGGAGTTLVYNNSGTGTTASHSACTAPENCPPTNKVSVAAPTDVFIDPTNLDFRLKQGTNALRNAGTSVSTRTAVGATDIGAYEQGLIESAAVVGGYIEAIVNVRTPGVTPTSNITAWSITCVGCTGSPVVSSAVVKAGTSNIVQLAISGITGTGSCTITYGSGNMTDSGYVGPPSQAMAQGVNSISGLSVTGICGNSAGGASPGTPYLHYKLNDGSGTNANDETVNNRDGTLSGGPTWQTPALDGYGLYFPNDGVDRRLTSPYGNALNPTAQSFTFCRSVKADSGIVNKIVTGTANGTSQRWYFGTYTGQTWQLGIQASAYSATGESEFPVQNKYTRICVVADASISTATLVVDGVMGTSAASRKTYSSYTLASNLTDGCGVSTTVYCGGVAIDEAKIWDRALNASELLQDFQEFNPAGSAVTCYGQATHKAELVYTDGVNPIAYGQPAADVYEVVDGGGIAAFIQINCTGTAGGAVALRFYYSTNGTDFDNEIPAALGAGGIAMWGASTEIGLNSGVATCCISGGLTANHGVTLVASNVSPTITLSTNHSYTLRLLLRFASGLVNQSRWIVAKQDNGTDLANAPTLGPMRFDLVNPRGGGMP